MKKQQLSQEGLKLIACVTMLIDHVGATLVPWVSLRIIGRLSFPIYCFLIAEGTYYTRNPRKYALRLLAGVFLSEPAFDMAFYGQRVWDSNSVMLTLLLGFLALQILRWNGNVLLKLLGVAMLISAGDLLFTDYGPAGVLLIVFFYVTRNLRQKLLIQLLGMTVLFYYIGGAELFALLAMIPISFYSGEKISNSKSLQWGFYLFYPVHLWILYFLEV